MIISRLLITSDIAESMPTLGSTEPTDQQLIGLTALVLDDEGQLAGPGIPVSWQADPYAGGADLLFYDENKQLITSTAASAKSLTNKDSIATIWVASFHITIVSINTAIDNDSSLVAATLVFHDPDPSIGNFTSPFLYGAQGVLNIPEDFIDGANEHPEIEALQSELGVYDQRYAAIATSGSLASKDYKVAFILNNNLVSLGTVAKTAEARGYIPYYQMHNDGMTRNILKFIFAAENGLQSHPLMFLAAGTPYQEPDPANSPNSQLYAPQFQGTSSSQVLTARNLINDRLLFLIPPSQAMNLQDQLTVILYLDGWSSLDGLTRVTKRQELHTYTLTSDNIKNGILIQIGSQAFLGYGMYNFGGHQQYGDLYLNYIINGCEYSKIYYSMMDFSGIQ